MQPNRSAPPFGPDSPTPPRTPGWVPGLGIPALFAALTLLAFLPSSAWAQGTNSSVTVVDGVYTAEQAERGENAFGTRCSACHATEEFQGPIWAIAWTGRSAGDFVNFISSTMPLDSPSSLSRQEYTDIVAYVLQLNGYPVGDEELPTDAGAQGEIVIEPPSDSR